MEQQVGVGDLLQRRAERLDQVVRQVADEAHGVGHRVHAAVGGRRTTRGGVERREERVLHQHAGVGEPVEQRRLAGVGVAGDRDARHVVATARLALDLAGAAHLLELAAQLGDLGVDAAPVGLDLGLTGTAAADALTAGGTTTGLARQVAAPAAQALLHVLQLRQLDLRLALLALRVLGEDVEDQRGAVDDLDLDLVLEVAQLAGRELAVADDGVGAGGLHDLADRLDLAAADVGRRVGLLAALEDGLEHLGAGGLGEQRELGHRVLGVRDRPLGPHADEHDLLQAELAVLDLGDVLELGAQAGDPAQGVPLGELLRAEGQLLGVVLVVVVVRRVVAGLAVLVEQGVLEQVVVELDRVVVPAAGGVEGVAQVEVRCVRHMSTRVGRAVPPARTVSRRADGRLPHVGLRRGADRP